ncbi:ParB/RepB/Spo0J family partition protein [Candidatus Poribacteria bacterium]|nr:ParB/RepB/Spo0J family partition protein [Candidatus Poribacteria bacterium]
MSEVKSIKVSSIDLESTINVRRTAVKDNVEKVKASIQEHGYWSDQPIIVRPHPNPNSQYQYEYVTGQCRFKACLELGLEEIPAFIEDLNDEQAIQRSWLENEVRGELTYSDRAYWVQKIYKRYSGGGYTGNEALELAAKYLGVTVPTIMGYFALVVLPEDVMQMVDNKTLSEKYAIAIARNTYDASRFGQSREAMRERASWVLSLDRDQRNDAVEALKQLGHKASIADLNAYVKKKIDESKRIVQYAIPQDLHDKLLEWGRKEGLEDESTIIRHMIARVLRGGID